VRIDAPDDALRAGDEIGERIAVGLDIEWEVGENGPPAGSVHGDVLVGRARHTIDGPGLFYDDGTADPGAIAGDAVATVKIPLDSGAGRYVERRLVRTEAGLRWSFEEHAPDR